MPHVVAGASSSKSKKSKKHDGIWKTVTVMNMRDLSRDDDYLSHILVEKLGTGHVPLQVHKMDSGYQVPKTDTDKLLQIVRRLIAFKGQRKAALTRAVEELLCLRPVQGYLTQYSTIRQINAFATHASRYFELYLPGGSIEIAHTSRYTHRTGKSELCILATRPLSKDQVIEELKGSMADLSPEEDQELKQTKEIHRDGVSVRRDFSVIHSKQLKKNHLFLGPARFVNHDCNHNVELFRTGRYITFRVLRPIAIGEEVTANYGEAYFGRNNRHCLCATCESLGRGGYRPHASDDEEDLSDSGAEANDGRSISGQSSSSSESDVDDNVNERRTRRGVYAVLPEEQPDAPMVLDAEVDVELGGASGSVSRQASTSRRPSRVKNETGLLTPDPESSSSSRGRTRGRSVTSTSDTPSPPDEIVDSNTTPQRFKSVISTRAQKARDASAGVSASRSRTRPRNVDSVEPTAARQLVSPPLTTKDTSTSGSAPNSSRAPSRARTRRDASVADRETASVSTSSKDKGKGKATASSIADPIDMIEPEQGRSLRPRAAVVTVVAEEELAKKMKDGPRGLDGKLLPICYTCGNILPVICIEEEVVWGHQVGRTGKRGRPRKNPDTDCPRCLRHLAIYNHKWPLRVEEDGNPAFDVPPAPFEKKFDPTAILEKAKIIANMSPAPRERRTSSRPDASISASGAKRRHETEDESHPSKKHRASTGRPRGRPPKKQPTMSAQARELLQTDLSNDGRRSGRNRIPSLKVRESSPPSSPVSPSSSSALRLRISPRKNPNSASAPVDGEHVSLGDFSISAPPRPVTPPPNGSSQPPVVTKTPKSMAVASQPREANGRFGRKYATNGRHTRKKYMMGGKLNRARKVNLIIRQDDGQQDTGQSDESEREEVEDSLVFGSQPLNNVLGREVTEDRDMFTPSNARNRFQEDFVMEAGPSKADGFGTDGEGYDEDDEEEDDNDVEEVTYACEHSPVARVGRGLLSRPNPIAFARRKWTRADDGDASDREDDQSDEGYGYLSNREDDPESDDMSPREGDEDEQDEDEGYSGRPRFPSRLLSRGPYLGPMTLKPSPLNLARRRWAPDPPLSRQNTVSRSTSRSATIRPLRSPSPDPHPMMGSMPLYKARARLLNQPSIASASIALDSDDSDEEQWHSSDDEMDRSDADDDVKLEFPDLGQAYVNRRQPNFDAIDVVDDDSERLVERLITLPSSSTPSSLGDSQSPRFQSPRLAPSPNYSPGLAWKRTVLHPTDEPCYSPKSVNTLPPAIPTLAPTLTPASPPTFIRAWGGDSSDIEHP